MTTNETPSDPLYDKVVSILSSGTPRSVPTTDLPRSFDPETGRVLYDRARKGEGPPDGVEQTARVICNNRGGRRGETLALVLVDYLVWSPMMDPASGEGPLVSLGADFNVTCRCGMTHTINGGRLRTALSNQRRRSGRVPVIDVRDIENT
ncbi:hypothetical protein [Aestuariimicrobium sp. Y1814]|uniref:hypothetical protein n=1 Tax=Aestuariimicrobium sp. Y1814 TaxID=3418742 RepID=UPI003DA6DDF0